MADKLMCIPNNGTQNHPFCRLKLVVETFRNCTKWTNQPRLNKSTVGFLSRRIRKRYYQTLRTSVINSPMSTPSLMCKCVPVQDIKIHIDVF